MARSSTYFYVLQFDQHLISALKVRRNSGEKLEIAGFWRQRGDWPAETGELAKALREFVQEHGLQGGEVYTILPRHEMTTRILTMPSQSKDEILRMVEYSAEEYVPYRRTEIVLDCVMLEAQPDGHSRVLAVLAHHDVVEQHVKRLQEAGLEPAGVFVSTACLASAARAAGSNEETGRYALANLGSAGFEVVIMHDGKLSFGRGIATAQDWTQAGNDP
ncbi:MAG: pilus assembly protein PilM, partial [Candidatus Hydrogenedentota bacterium]